MTYFECHIRVEDLKISVDLQFPVARGMFFHLNQLK